MPQMSPLMWLILFMFFSFIYILSLVKTYYSSPSSISMNSKLESINNVLNKMYWKW